MLFVCFHAARYEKFKFQLSKKYVCENMTGLLLIYPSCLLHVIEVSFTANKYCQYPSVIKVFEVALKFFSVSPPVIQGGSAFSFGRLVMMLSCSTDEYYCILSII